MKTLGEIEGVQYIAKKTTDSFYQTMILFVGFDALGTWLAITSPAGVSCFIGVINVLLWSGLIVVCALYRFFRKTFIALCIIMSLSFTLYGLSALFSAPVSGISVGGLILILILFR